VAILLLMAISPGGSRVRWQATGHAHEVPHSSGGLSVNIAQIYIDTGAAAASPRTAGPGGRSSLGAMVASVAAEDGAGRAADAAAVPMSDADRCVAGWGWDWGRDLASRQA